jgi:hypothetical protein
MRLSFTRRLGLSLAAQSSGLSAILTSVSATESASRESLAHTA